MKHPLLTGLFALTALLILASYVVMILTNVSYGASYFTYQPFPPSDFGSFYPVASFITSYIAEIGVFAAFMLILAFYPKLKVVGVMLISEFVVVLWTVGLI